MIEGVDNDIYKLIVQSEMIQQPASQASAQSSSAPPPPREQQLACRATPHTEAQLLALFRSLGEPPSAAEKEPKAEEKLDSNAVDGILAVLINDRETYPILLEELQFQLGNTDVYTIDFLIPSFSRYQKP